uniref:Uncharacterized protein n=1 Tax=Rhizophora mucronata TaxID=61149 RepID=A0A2P2QMP4_RHIMU
MIFSVDFKFSLAGKYHLFQISLDSFSSTCISVDCVDICRES